MDAAVSGAREVVLRRVPLTSHQEKRLRSILRQHAVLFSDGLAGSDRSVRTECLELIGSLGGLSDHQALRVVSILRQHELIFGAEAGPDSHAAGNDHEELAAAVLLTAAEEMPEAPAPAPPGPPAAEPPAPVAAPLPPAIEPAAPAEPLGEAEIRLFGPGRRRFIPETRGMLLFHHFSDAAASGSVSFIPLGSVASLDVGRDPVAVVVRGPIHALAVVAPGGPRIGLDLRAWGGPLPAPFDADDLYSIRLRGGGTIGLSVSPRAPDAPCTIVGSQGVYGYFIPPGARAFERTVLILRGFLARRGGASSDIADGVAYFAARRLMGFGFSGVREQPPPA